MRLLLPLRLLGTVLGALALLGVGMAAGARRVLGRRTPWDELPEWGRGFVRHTTAQWNDHGRVGCSWRILARYFDDGDEHSPAEIRRTLVAGGWLREIHDAGGEGHDDGFIPCPLRSVPLPRRHARRSRARAMA